MRPKEALLRDRWILCEKHNEWYPKMSGFCSGCYPKIALWTRILSVIFTLILLGMFIGLVFYVFKTLP